MLARPCLLAIDQERNGGACEVDEQLLTGAVNLAHGALEAFGKLAVVLTELRVAPGLDGIVGAVLVANLGAVFLPQQHERDAFAAQFLVDAPVVGLGIGVAGTGRGQQPSLQRGFVHGRYSLPVQSSGNRQAHVLGDNTFGDAQGTGDLLVGLSTLEFQTQRVFEFAHIDP